jgi:hypothetical protein
MTANKSFENHANIDNGEMPLKIKTRKLKAD